MRHDEEAKGGLKTSFRWEQEKMKWFVPSQPIRLGWKTQLWYFVCLRSLIAGLNQLAPHEDDSVQANNSKLGCPSSSIAGHLP